MDDPFDDSEGDGELLQAPPPFKARGFGGLVQLESEDDDFGEEMSAYAAAFRRTGRRLDRWDGQKDLHLGVMGTNRVSQAKSGSVNGHDTVRDADETEDERPPEEDIKSRANGDTHLVDEEDLDDMEKEILGLGSEVEEDGEEDLDDVDKALLGLAGDGDETEEEVSDGGMDVD
jgi:Ino eighty subunit 1